MRDGDDRYNCAFCARIYKISADGSWSATERGIAPVKLPTNILAQLILRTAIEDGIVAEGGDYSDPNPMSREQDDLWRCIEILDDWLKAHLDSVG